MSTHNICFHAILSVLLETSNSKDSQTDLVKFYVQYVQSPNICDNFGIILHKKMLKKKSPPTLHLPYLFFSYMLP